MKRFPPSRILVAVDFGEASAAALALAGRIAGPAGAELVLLHAESIDVPPYFTHEQLDAVEREVRSARHQAEDALRDFARVHTTVPVTVHLASSSEVDAILEASRDADLIVMGTHGRRGPKRWWLGSVAERIVREAHLPVLVVHAQPGDARRPAPLLSPVVLGGEKAGADAHRWGEFVASVLGGKLCDGPDPDACESAHLDAASLVVVTLPERPGQRVVHEHVVSLARTCTVPVLFVPDSGPVPSATDAVARAQGAAR